ncbi:MAG: PAS domain S-box protein [Algoriphagus sp.]|uniref:PAS domain S-box protein n=1 Tax=Algoriphagus sp. TaxID=1872435 RepID=UPI002730C5BF|nr:PAS domain S-box protein [Algoriphagus sp.]MDP2042261.1 PAS domain S-box protein [Algoriphagus sp.]MDP3473982.1 PAS domain S-box protein [Algoriphagus sp.]
MEANPTDYSSLFYLSPLPQWVYDISTFEILDVNEAAIQHYGYSRDEFLKMTIKDLRPKEEIPKLVAAHIDIGSQHGNIYFGAFTHQKKKREKIRMKINGHKVDFQGRKCVLVICQDVSEEEIKTQLIKESEERLKAASAIAKLGYWRFELESQSITWTDEVYKIWGRQKDNFEINFENLLKTIHPDDQDAFDLEDQTVRPGGKNVDIIHRIILPDKSIRWVHAIGRVKPSEEGKPVIFEGTVQDVTAQKQEDQRLKLLESVITNTSDAILITEAEPFDEPGPRIVYVNEAFTKMTGYTAEEVIGKTPRILQGPKSDKAELARLSKALRNWESCEITTINYKKNGEEFWINFTVSPVANEKGWFTHWIAVERDVTDKKNRQLEQNLLSQISLIFNEEKKLVDATQGLCTAFADFGGFDFVEVWTPNLENSHIQLLNFSHHSEQAAKFYADAGAIRQFEIGDGLPGVVYKTKKPILLNPREYSETFIRKLAAVNSGISAVLGLPLLFNDTVVGVLVIGDTKEAKFMKRFVKLFHRLENFIGSEINRKSLETNLQNLFEAIPDIVCLADFQGRFLRMNKAGSKLLGYSEEELLYHSFDEFVHPEDKEISANEVMKLSEGETTFKFENRYKTKSGEIVWLSWTCNSEVEAGVIYASAKNITKEKKLSELNRLSSKLAKIGSWEVDVTGNRLFWSDIVYDLHETDPASFSPDLETAINLYRPDFKEFVQNQVNACITEGIPFDFEAVLITLKNNERWVRAIGKAEFRDGVCTRLYGSFQDIHERKESELRLKSISDNLPGVVFRYIINPDGSDAMKYVSLGAKEIWGYSAEDSINDNNLIWNGIKAGGDFEEVQVSIIESVKNKMKWTAKWRYMMPSGELRFHIGHGTPEYLTDGTVVFNSLILDITEEKKNEELLNQASAMAHIGSWELDLLNQEGDSMFWSPMTRKILGVPNDYNPTLTGGFEFYTEDSKARIQHAVDLLIHEGNEFDEELHVITARGDDRWIRCIGRGEWAGGKCVKIFGSFQDIHATKSLQLQLSEILGSISDAFYAVDKNWNFTYFNREAENLLLKKAEEVLGNNIWELFPAAVGTLIQEVYERVASTEKAESFEILYPGDSKWYEINAYPSNGGVSAYFKNIEERKQADEKLEKAFKEKNNILERVGDAFFALDKDWTVTYWNKRAEEIIGIKREDLVGYNLWEKFPLAKDLEFFKQYERAFQTQSPVHFEEFFEPLNQWYEANGYPSPEGISVFFRDITEKKQIAEKILRANERFEKVTEATNDAIWDWDLENKTFFRSNGIEKLFGENASKSLTEEDFWEDAFHPEDLPQIQKSISEAIEDPDISRWEMEYRILKEDGNIGYVVDKGIVIRNKKGKAVRMVGAMTDISERKLHEAELLELNESLKKHAHELELTNEQLEQFAFIASHDLQEPLRMISSFLDQLKRKYGGQLDDKAHQYIHFATDGAKRMKQIILDLLEYSRAGKLEENKVKINLDQLIGDYKSLRKKIIHEKTVVIDHPPLPVIDGYRAPFTQVIHCLLDNAIKYSRDGIAPRIELGVQETGSEWMFSVRDNGLGIAPEFFDKIFVIFQRLHNRDQYGGSGIGLSIVKKQVESWGGKVWLSSKLGEGSVFYFSVPKV